MTTSLKHPPEADRVDAAEAGAADLEVSPVVEAGELERLRTLLLRSEMEALKALRARLDDPVVRAQELADVLPQAIAIRAAQDQRLGHALQGTVDEALRSSVRRDPRHLTDAIFPVLGPGIRKAISTTLLGMVQSLSETLNQGLSVRGLRWRLQAWRSGVPYGEVVLLNTLLFRVEQVALVHREQGVVLAHAVAPDVGAQDSDLVFGMLSAIQSFMEDAFDETGSRLDTVRIGGDLSLWVEESADAVLALVVRGTPPAEVRKKARDLLAQTQRSYHQQLANFDGNDVPFAALLEPLESLLESRFHEKKRRIGALAWVVCALLVALPLGWLGVTEFRRQALDTFAEGVNAQEGIVVTRSGMRDGSYLIEGFRDPLAATPETLLAGSRFGADEVDFFFEPYQALSSGMVLARVNERLTPPADVALLLDGPILRVSGTADATWARMLLDSAGFLSGVTQLDVSGLAVPEFDRVADLITQLESLHVFAPKASADPVPDQAPVLEQAARLTQALEVERESLGVPLQVLILGFTDPTGEASFNNQLSNARAQRIAELLVAAGTSANMLLSAGRGVADPGGESVHNQGRYVTFRVLGAAELREWRTAR